MSLPPDEWIALVLGRASELRAAGVLSVGSGGCVVTFAPLPPKEPEMSASDEKRTEREWTAPVDETPRSPWEDPSSYPSGVVPTLEIEELPREDRRR